MEELKIDLNEFKWSFRAAYAVFIRDLMVFRKDIRGNLMRILGQPMFFLIVFGLLLPQLDVFMIDYIEILVPGIIAMTAMLGAMRSVGGEIGISFDHNQEIRAHILLPLTMASLALEKIIYGMFQGVFSGLAVLILAIILFPETFTLTLTSLIVLIIIFMATGIIFGGMGLGIGSYFEPPEIMFEIMFLITMPMMFLGATFYPVDMVREISEILYYFTFGIPLTYVSESIRVFIAPETAGLPLIACIIGLIISIAIFVPIGIWGFKQRAIN
ncbi:ABC transporter permease [Methanonatronarchaeum sp. AMET-Sl]|uniref:ABC transporter permease n=1 Tax=Methanonatronarchaeum sp. AMET-Sl TaxID=3037654 RepID=UPI00244E3005|nr:ABC transporter permease [Methanonatronarchaeum sp. AMET-Sl]WGI17853.1 ABC transporter permease [Methanonatronarchaeum sp. AMET-Sl]